MRLLLQEERTVERMNSLTGFGSRVVNKSSLMFRHGVISVILFFGVAVDSTRVINAGSASSNCLSTEGDLLVSSFSTDEVRCYKGPFAATPGEAAYEYNRA